MERSEHWILGDPSEPAPAKPRTQPRPPRRRKRRGSMLGRLALFSIWTVFVLSGTLGIAAFATGVLRDGTFADASSPVELAHADDWASVAFRPWVPGRYLVYLVSDDAADRETPRAFGGRLYARIVAPDGHVEMLERFERPGLNHEIAGGQQWTRLAELHVIAPTYDPWILSARVAEPDPEFAGTSSSLLIRRDRKATGLEGLSNYVLAVPATISLFLSLLVAVWLARRGGTWMPTLLSILALGACGAIYALMRGGI